MKNPVTFIVAALVSAAIVGAEPLADVPASEEPPGTGAEVVAPTSAAEALYSTIARFPVEPVSIGGTLILRKQSGVIVREVPFQAEIDFGKDPATATYFVLDGFGRTLNMMRVRRDSNGKIVSEYFDGEEKPLAVPSITAPVAGTDITWLDITLSYLWWKDGEITGSEEYKGALCDIVEVRPPEPIPGCALVRLWIDRKRGFMRQAEQIDENGERVRWMWVASVGKIKDRWMIKNLEVKRPGTGLQTKFHVDDMETP